MMGRLISRERELELDLETGGLTSEEDGMSNHSSANGESSTLLKRAWTGPLGFDGSTNSPNFDEVAAANVELFINKNSEGEGNQQHISFLDNKNVEVKQKKKNLRKPPKPPRPPKGLSVDAADQKLMQEITQLAVKKRARIERLKAVEKLRAAKASSWSSSITATIITVVFLLIIIYQGICSTNEGSLSFKGFPEPAVAASEGLVSVQFSKDNVIFGSDEPGAGFTGLAGRQVSGSGLRKKQNR